ncbi:MAG TPA: excinuclease ABC subunit UvrC [Clostridia bacterium]|nr:excinuclease ABC subunit UvrC [Clostridia bacterium]
MFNIQEELKKLPDKPGVYIMKDENSNIIYIGKAVVLKNRVRQYFQSSSNMTPKTQVMVSKIREFEYIVTDSETEALILECNLIKTHKPKFNILLKDDKSYPYIKVTMNEEYPRILTVRRLEKDKARYFGPYTGGFAVKETISLLKKLFPLKSCNKVFPRDVGKERPCLNYHIGQCLGPCQGNVDKEKYRELMEDICSFLDGKQDKISGRLEEQMKEAAERMEFEKAAILRDKLNNLKHVAEKQKVLSTQSEDQDVVAFARDEADSCVQVFFIRGGKLIGREHFVIEGTAGVEDSELLNSFMKQYYNSALFIPGEVIIQSEIDDTDVIENWLSGKRGARVYIRVPQRGEKLSLIKMVSQNAFIALSRFKEKINKEKTMSEEGLREFAGLLGIDAIPERIEAYDISNTGSSEIVASMVVFRNGMPDKKEYRRFKVKSINIQNDYASMQEVIFRRFRHAEDERKLEKESDSKNKKFSNLPDIILLDGGLGHVNAVKEVLDQLNVRIPLFGMVKDDKHRTRGLVSQETEFDLAGKLTVLRFVTAIQDEAHRFAIDYNKKLRTKRYTVSVLDSIDGIGPKRKKALIRHFGSVEKIKKAEVDDLLAVEGISRDTALKIYNHFH